MTHEHTSGKNKRAREHLASVLEKKLRGETTEEMSYNADSAELKRLTKRDVLYIGPNARANMQAGLWQHVKKQHCVQTQYH